MRDDRASLKIAATRSSIPAFAHGPEAFFNALAFGFAQPVDALASRFDLARHLGKLLLVPLGPGRHALKKGFHYWAHGRSRKVNARIARRAPFSLL